jgi:hypothetical protein
MPDVFISYKKSDADRVRSLVEHLSAAGFDVWWDVGIQPSTSWRHPKVTDEIVRGL